MSNTRKAAPKPPPVEEELEPTPVSAWAKQGTVVKLPSGKAMRIKKTGIMDLAHDGLVPNALMSIIMTSVQKGQQPKVEDILSDKIELSAMFEMMDNAVIKMALEPQVHPLPEEGKERRSDRLYIDQIDEEDKMFLWHIATGGTADVEQFRKQRAGLLDSLPGQSPVASPAKRTPARKR